MKAFRVIELLIIVLIGVGVTASLSQAQADTGVSPVASQIEIVG